MSFIVAIDGTAGSGKGTMANAIANDLGFISIDTGATYRCVALASIRENIPYEDKEGIIKLLDRIEIDIQGDNLNPIFLLNGEDVSKEIRSAEVTKIVSQVSCIPEVRLKLVELQRKLAIGKNVVMDGRDIGTYVFPNADVKIYLDATEEVRAKRRWEENQEKGINMTYEETLENIRMRDKQDKEKEIGALKKADDAIVIDTTDLSIEEVKEKIEKIVKSKYVVK
ncbi:MAG: (d)CMP kinase [Clostridia bacterium]|nr:(d)CMP kinase [Clostridia bacterium]